VWQVKGVKVSYTKMHGAGNDFIVVDDRSKTFAVEDVARIRAMCNRETGIGSDGLILLQPSRYASIRMRFFNPDGGEVSMCGNGARCITRFAADLGLVQTRIDIETGAGVIEAHLDRDRICLRLGEWQEADLDVCVTEDYRLDVIDTGVPHAVMWLKNLNAVEEMELESFGALIRYHSFFSPDGINVSVATVDEAGGVHLRTYERGVEGETLACGTGALAAARLAVLRKKSDYPVEVFCRSGEVLTVDSQADCAVLMGGATVVNKGCWEDGSRL
jgi:diaminopimelate epimerase